MSVYTENVPFASRQVARFEVFFFRLLKAFRMPEV